MTVCSDMRSALEFRYSYSVAVTCLALCDEGISAGQCKLCALSSHSHDEDVSSIVSHTRAGS